MGCGFQIRISIHFNDSSGIITAEVQHEGASVGLTRCRQIADSQSVVQAEHGAAGAHRSVLGWIVEFVVGTQIEHGIVISLDVNRREGAREVNIVRIGMAAANGAYSNAAENRIEKIFARLPLHEVRRASSEGCQAAGGKVECQFARRDVVVGRFEGLHCGTCEGRALEHEVKGQAKRVP